MNVIDIEAFLFQHRIWLEFFIAIGTVAASLIALCVALKTSLDLKREKLSGISISCSDDAIVTLENNSKIDVNIELWLHELTDGKDKKESLHYLKIPDKDLRSEITKNNKWSHLRIYDLSSQEKVQFHLKDVGSSNEIYATFIALKMIIDGERYKYYVLRFSGYKSSESDVLLFAHPQLKWVINSSFWR